MTSPDDVPLDESRDGSTDGPSKGTPDGPVEPRDPFGPSFDEDAAWRLIVENYGERPGLGSTALDPQAPSPTDRPGEPADPLAPGDRADPADPVAGAHTRRRTDGPDLDPDQDQDQGRDQDRDGRTEHEHYVPPEPPPVPRATPARRIAWAGLFASPLLMILAVVLDWAVPTWLSMLMVAGFVGGFVFLVATMPRDGGDGWGDGAVV